MAIYRIIYTWNILEGIVPNVGIQLYTSTRQGRLCRIPPKTAKTRLGLTHTHSLTPSNVVAHIYQLPPLVTHLHPKSTYPPIQAPTYLFNYLLSHSPTNQSTYSLSQSQTHRLYTIKITHIHS